MSRERRLKPKYEATIPSTVTAIRSSGRDDPARTDDGLTLVKKRTRSPVLKTKAVIGTLGSSTVKAKTGRYVAVFVPRLLPETTAEQMEAFVQETHHLSSKCVKLETKHHSYASFKVEVTCDNIPDIPRSGQWVLTLEDTTMASLLDWKLLSVLSTVMDLKASSRVLKPCFQIAIYCVCKKLC